MSKRAFYRNVITITILSEEPLEKEPSLSAIEYLITYGGCSGKTDTTISNEAVDGATMAKLLQEQHSDPSYFGLDDEGNDLDDEENGEGI
jgi:uncharacterized protein YuzB (UPF0349 family)